MRKSYRNAHALTLIFNFTHTDTRHHTQIRTYPHTQPHTPPFQAQKKCTHRLATQINTGGTKSKLSLSRVKCGLTYHLVAPNTMLIQRDWEEYNHVANTAMTLGKDQLGSTGTSIWYRWFGQREDEPLVVAPSGRASCCMAAEFSPGGKSSHEGGQSGAWPRRA